MRRNRALTMFRGDRGSNGVVVTNLDAEGTPRQCKVALPATALSHWHVIHAHGQLGSTNTSTPVTPASCRVRHHPRHDPSKSSTSLAHVAAGLHRPILGAVADRRVLRRVCPWCWLGKRRLERALEQLDFADEIEVHWRAFQWDPRAPVEPRPYAEVLARKYGPDAVSRITNRLGQLGRQEGLDYRWDRVQHANSSTHTACSRGRQHAALTPRTRSPSDSFALTSRRRERCRPEHWPRSQGSRPRCRRRGGDAEADAFADEVRDDFVEAVENDVLGVPAFLLAPGFAIPGAQEVETFKMMLTRVHDRRS